MKLNLFDFKYTLQRLKYIYTSQCKVLISSIPILFLQTGHLLFLASIVPVIQGLQNVWKHFANTQAFSFKPQTEQVIIFYYFLVNNKIN